MHPVQLICSSGGYDRLEGPWIRCALSQSFVLPCALRSMNLVFVFLKQQDHTWEAAFRRTAVSLILGRRSQLAQ
jgi:hypothetical protein